MNYIVFDLEFNQDFSSPQSFGRKKSDYPFEIIQIGAVKLDDKLHITDEFNRYVRPTLYAEVSPFITQLTGITTQQLLNEESFPEVYKAYSDFIGAHDAVFCIWGMADIKELFKNAMQHHLNYKLLPNKFINLQPSASIHFNLSPKKLMRLQHAAMALNIDTELPFHNALYDAIYTAKIFQKIYHPSFTPSLYDPLFIPIRQKQPQRKRIIDADRLLEQFEKMYDRQMTAEEKSIILLAYKMGKTHQFLK